MRNIVLHLAFDGTRYHGWQVQENAISVQQTIQDGFERVFNARLPVKGCSRTDAGVHAYDYVCNFFTNSPLPCDAILRALNANLPRDIAVTACEEASEDFHVRYSATGKEYVYQIWNESVRNPFFLGYAMFYPRRLNVELLDSAAAAFRGRHDFAAFQSSRAISRHRPLQNGISTDEDSSGTIRTIFNTSVTREGGMVRFRVHGDGFLYNMVRIMTGTLLFVAQGKLSCGGVEEVISSCDRKMAGPTAPACGLYLNRVFYGGNL